jgi:hypothetical protein
MVDRDKRIGKIAYRLWEEAGKPHGQDQHFWHVAVEQYEAEIGVTGRVPAEEPAAEPEAPASKAEPKAPAPKKHAPAKAKAVAAEPAPEPAKPKPDAKAAKDDKPKPGKAKANKTKDDGAPLTASWIKSEPTAKPKGGKSKS